MSETAAKPGPGNVANLPAKTSFKPLKQCATLAEAFRTQEFFERIQASVPQHVQPNRMLRLFEQSVTKAPLLAEATVRSFVGACLTLSQVGLEPNTPLGHGYLIPFKTKAWNPATRKRDQDIVEINVIFGYPGLLDLSYRTKLVRAVHADVVWPGDEFSFEYGSDAHVRHKPRGMRKPEDRPVYAYMHATLADGQAFEVMPYQEVLAIRDKSQAYRSAVEQRDNAASKGWSVPRGWTDAPWVAHEIAMARKTVFRSGSKWLPRSVEVASVIALDEAQDRRKSMDFGAVMDAPTIDGKVDYLGAAVDESERPEDEPATPGAAFSDRRPADDTAAKAKAAEEAERKRSVAAEQAAAKARAEAARRPAETKPPAEAKPATAASSLDFEAYLIDPAGDATGPAFSNPTQFARAFIMLWRAENEAENAEAIDALLAFNADTLEQLRAEYPEAAGVLAEIDQSGEPESQTESQTAYVTVTPPIERGKTSWPGYVKLIRAEAEKHGPDTLPGWLDMQKTALSEAPFAQRLLAIRAISDRIAAFGLTAPIWLGDLMRAKPAGDPPADPRVADEKWVDRTVAEVGGITSRAEFDTYFRSQAIRTVMMRLKASAPDLFERADSAFAAKHAALPPAEGTPA